MRKERHEYTRKFQRAWVRRRRAEWIAAHGPCAQCGSSERLEVDHKNPAEKEIPTRALWGMSPGNPKRIAELAKCQVLCHRCHRAKTSREQRALFAGRRTFVQNSSRKTLEELQKEMRERMSRQASFSVPLGVRVEAGAEKSRAEGV